MVEASPVSSMATERAPEVRLVKCPKCRRVLPEVPDVPVYKCGGCETILIAKNHKMNSRRTLFGSQQSLGPEAKECSSLVREETLPSPGECSSSNKNVCEDLEQLVDGFSKLQVGVNISCEGQNSKTNQDRTSFGNNELPVHEKDCLLVELASQRTGGTSDVVEEDHEGLSLASARSRVVTDESSLFSQSNMEVQGMDERLSSSGTVNGESSQLPEPHSEIEETNDCRSQAIAPSEDEVNNKWSASPTTRVQFEQVPNDENSESPEPCAEMDENSEHSPSVAPHSEDEKNCETLSSPQATTVLVGKNEWPASPTTHSTSAVDDVTSIQPSENHSETEDCSSLPSTEFEDDMHDESLPSTPGICSEADENDKSTAAAGAYPDLEDKYEKSLEEEKSEPGPNTACNSNARSSNTDNLLVGEGISSHTLLPSFDEQSQKTVRRGFHHAKSVDSLESTEFLHDSFESNGALEHMSKCPTSKSSLGYESCISSFEEMDSTFPGQHLHSFKHICDEASEESIRRGKFPVNGYSEPEAKNMKSNFSPVLSHEKHYSSENNTWSRDIPGTRRGHAIRTYPRIDRNDFQAQVPFYQRGSQAGYESGSSSSQIQNKLNRSSTCHSHGQYGYADDKMKLLKMVFELQDQLKHRHHMHGMENGGLCVSRDRDLESLEEMYQDLNQHRYRGRYNQGSFLAQPSKFYRIPFSGETANFRHRVDGWHSSAELPPPAPSYNQRFHRVYPCECCDTSYSSCPASPLEYMHSEYPVWSRETKSDDQWPGDNEVKKFMREKQYLAKRHLQPTAGGAPFISCYLCFKVLQMPADFLLFERKCHRLRCGSCKEILKFSRLGKTHIVPYTVRAPPPNDVPSQNNLSAASPANKSPNADSVSFSVDYDHSYSKSYSTDGDPVRDRWDNSRDSNVRNGSRESNELIMKQPRNKLKKPVVVNYDSPGSPFKNKQNEQRSGGSPLHRLFGYSSPSSMIFGRSQSVAGPSSVAGSPGKGLEPRS